MSVSVVSGKLLLYLIGVNATGSELGGSGQGPQQHFLLTPEGRGGRQVSS